MEDAYFPNQSKPNLQLERRFRREVEQLPEPSRLILYELLSSVVATFKPVSFVSKDRIVVAKQGGRQIAFSSPIPMVKLAHIVFGYEEWLQRKYCLPGFVEVEAGDTVVDCGAFVGGFSLSACRIAAHVHAFEPEQANFACLRKNFAADERVSPNHVGLFSKNGIMNLNISKSSVEHSLLRPDDGDAVAIQQIEILTLKEYSTRHKIAKFDFVKIEAEGVELEVFEGLEDLRPRKLAIDVGPERDGESPADEFRARLTSLGYTIRQRGNVMFARQ